MNRILIFVFLVLPLVTLRAQTLARNDQLKFDADYYLMEKDFNKARNNYLTILKSEPENADMKYKLGICYLNSENEKAKAIPYLEEAAQKISEKYNPSSFKETNAPVDALFLLGSAYRVNNELDKAIDAYSRYKEYLDPKDEYNQQVISQYISSCHTAKEMQNKPVGLITINMGGRINTSAPNFNAVVSGDGRTLFYTSPGRQGYDIYTATFADTAWTSPKIMTSVLGTGRYMKTSDLSADGQTLLLVLDDPMNADIYVCRFIKGRWSKAEPLGKEINSKSAETHASLSADGKTLYFTSNRKGGVGDMDIYKSELDAKGEWGKAVNLGPTVNTRFNEETPFVTDDGRQLFFSSEGHPGLGGYDIFRFDFNDPEAGVLNLGYPLNTTDNDLFYVPVGDGTTGLLAFNGADSYGGRDIYSVTLLPPAVEEVAYFDSAQYPVAAEEAAYFDSAQYPVVAEEAAAVAVEEEAAAAAAVAVEEEAAAAEEVAAAVAVEETIIETPVTATATAPATDFTATDFTATAAAPATDLESARSYTVQFMALRKASDPAVFEGVSGVTMTLGADKWYRYTTGTSTVFSQAQKEQEQLAAKGYHDAFVRGKAVIPNYTIQVMAVPGPVIDLTRFSNLPEVSVTRGADGFCRYTTGEFENPDDARVYLEQVKALGYPKAFVARTGVK
ncbi:MAG: tetratricopeptide repeat protein [Bacteroidales bacterium]